MFWAHVQRTVHSVVGQFPISQQSGSYSTNGHKRVYHY